MVYSHDDWTYFFHTRRFSSYVHKNPCCNEYPNYYNAKRFEVILNEGDALYIPSGWFHHIYSETTTSNINMSINFWTDTNKNEKNIFQQSYTHIEHIPSLDISSNFNYDMHVANSQPFTFFTSINNKSITTLHHVFNNILLNNCKQSNNTFVSHLIDLNPDDKYSYISFTDFLNQTELYNYVLGNNISHHLNNHSWIQSLMPSFLKNKNIYSHVWLNHGHVSTRNHYDIYENVLLQVYGSKRVLLSPPDERNNLYMINPYPLDFILSLNNMINNDAMYKNFIVDNTMIINKYNPCIQFYKESLQLNKCSEIIHLLKKNNAKCGYIKLPEIDTYFFETLNHYLNKYLSTLKILNISINCENFSDSGYYIENKFVNNHSAVIPTGAALKYIWFLNDSEPSFINNIEIKAIAGSLLIYPVHFSYKETDSKLTQDKWICSGFICL